MSDHINRKPLSIKEKVTKTLYPKLKFGAGSIVSTGVDYSVFFFLLETTSFLPVASIQAIAQSSGMLTNFFLQRNYIFSKERSLISSFVWSISFSLISIVLSSILVHFLYGMTFFFDHPIIMKIGVSTLFFFFNFYTKQFAFEKKLKW